MAIFMLLNGMGLAFLLYTLVNFWNEGKRSVNAARERRTVLRHIYKPDLIVVKRPVSRRNPGGVTVMSVQFQHNNPPRNHARAQSDGTTATTSLQEFRRSK